MYKGRGGYGYNREKGVSKRERSMGIGTEGD
jgi:hypothetical protein